MAEVDKSILSGRWSRGGRISAKQHCIDAPTSRAVKNHEQKYPAQNHGQFSFVQNWEELLDRGRCMGERLARGVYHKISNSHFTAGNERSQTREQTKCDQETANEFNNSAHEHQALRAAVSTTGKTEKLLAAVTSINQPHD